MSTEAEPGHSDPHPLTDHGKKHGRPVSWVFVGGVLAVFTLGGVALILGWWLVFFVCAGLFALSPVAGALIGIMQDTVQWTIPATRLPERRERIDDLHRPD